MVANADVSIRQGQRYALDNREIFNLCNTGWPRGQDDLPIQALIPISSRAITYSAANRSI